MELDLIFVLEKEKERWFDLEEGKIADLKSSSCQSYRTLDLFPALVHLIHILIFIWRKSGLVLLLRSELPKKILNKK